MALIALKTTHPVPYPRARRVVYPTSDEEPMGETDLHRDVNFYLIEGLKAHYADRPDVYVSGDNFIYYVKGAPKRFVSPDVYVVFGVSKRQRDTFMTWKEGGKRPAVVIEVTSRATERDDIGRKLDLYERTLRVPEYFLYDPKGEYLDPPLAGFRLNERGEYIPLLLGDGDRLHSEQLGLDLVLEEGRLRLFDPVRGAFLLSSQEIREQAADEAQRADAEAEARKTAEAEVARLRAELDSLREERRP
jgi:Uma2 family endonuclease